MGKKHAPKIVPGTEIRHANRALADRVMGADAATAFFRTPQPALKGNTPKAASKEGESGARRVQDILKRTIARSGLRAS